MTTSTIGVTISLVIAKLSSKTTWDFENVPHCNYALARLIAFSALVALTALIIKYTCTTDIEENVLIVGEIMGVLLGVETPWNTHPWKNSFRESPFTNRNLHYLYPFVNMHLKVLQGISIFAWIFQIHMKNIL